MEQVSKAYYCLLMSWPFSSHQAVYQGLVCQKNTAVVTLRKAATQMARNHNDCDALRQLWVLVCIGSHASSNSDRQSHL